MSYASNLKERADKGEKLKFSEYHILKNYLKDEETKKTFEEWEKDEKIKKEKEILTGRLA